MKQASGPVLRLWSTLTLGIAFTSPSYADSTSVPTQIASAEGDPAARGASAEAEFERGSRLFQEKQYEQSIVHFARAHQLRPSPELLFNIGLAHDKLKNTAAALRYYREYLHEVESAGEDAKIRARVSALEQQLAEDGVQQVTLRSEPSGATVLIDDRQVGTTPWTGELEPGRHDAELRLEGYEPTRLTFTLSLRAALDLAGSLRQISTHSQQPSGPSRELSDSAETPPAFVESTQEVSMDPAADYGAWPWVSIGLSLASGITAGTFELARRSAQEDARNAQSHARFVDSVERSESHQTTARVAAGASAVFLTAGVLLLVLDAASDSDSALTCPSDCRLTVNF